MFEHAEKIWSGLSNEEKDYLLRTHVLTPSEARERLGISSQRLKVLLNDSKIAYVKSDRSATLYSDYEIERRKSEAVGLREKYLPKKK